jgi:hypothetical protein
MALGINPNSPWANRVLGSLLVFGGRPSEGRDALLTAMRLSPRHPANAIPMAQIAASYYFERDYENASESAKRAVARYPGNPWHIDFCQHHWANWVVIRKHAKFWNRRWRFQQRVSIFTLVPVPHGIVQRITNTCSTV